MSKSILYLGGFELPDKNAAAQRVIANAKLLREMGFEVSFIGISKDIENTPREVEGFESNPVPYPTGTKEWMRQIFTFVETDAILKRNPDYVVLYNFPAIASLRILKACRNKGIKVIHDLTEWEIASGWSPREIIRKMDINLRMHYCMKRMDGIIAISRYLYEYYSRYTNVILVPPTVDLTNPKFNRERELIANSPVKLVLAGNIGGGKKDRIDYIIDSIYNNSSLQLTVVGMTIEQYENFYGSLPKDCNNVVFKGRVSHQEAVKFVCDSDFQMLIRENSLKNKAGFPTKFVESMSCCTPIIANISSNICDYLVDGKNGFIVNEISLLNEVLDKVSRLTKEEIIAMKEECRSFTGFDYRNFKDDFLKIFN
ncbi:MAG: glycosyltransferase family 4 protein [Bacteroidales bacterium]|nr:glycosyltransferase family 4 protein [Bacteroidales bacterium]